MNRRSLLFLIVAGCMTCTGPAQDRSTPAEKPRKTLTFPTGAKASAGGTPAATPAAAPFASPAPRGAGATNPLGIDEPGQAAAAFFALLQKRQIDEAYAGLTKGSKIGERPEELAALKTKTNEAIEVFGAIQGYDLVESKPFGNYLLRRTYISLGRDFPLRWRFYFYRTENQWRLVDLRVDDRLTEMFSEPDEARTPETKAP